MKTLADILPSEQDEEDAFNPPYVKAHEEFETTLLPEEEGKRGPEERGEPRPVLIQPGGPTQYIDTATVLFAAFAKEYLYFVRGRAIVEIAFGKILKGDQLHNIFQLLEPDSLRSRIEYVFECKAWREKGGGSLLKPARCTHDGATVLLKTREAFKLLPPVTTLVPPRQ